MQERVLFPGRSFVFWLTLALLVLASILATEGEFIVEAICSPHCCQCNCAQGTSHRHLNKSRAQIRFPRKKKGQMDEENPAFSRRTRPADNRIYFYDATLSKHILHNVTPRWLKKIIACFGKIWKPPKQVSGSFEVWQKSRDSTLIVDRVFS